MDKCIFINVNMFTRNSQVFINYEANNPSFIGNYPLEGLPKVTIDLAHTKEIYNVKISGASKFAQLIEYEINSKEMTKYNENKIKVEVI